MTVLGRGRYANGLALFDTAGVAGAGIDDSLWNTRPAAFGDKFRSKPMVTILARGFALRATADGDC
jgi:hypothetical protein